MLNIHDLLAPWRGSAVFAAAAAFAAAALSPLAQGASVTFTSSNCSSYVLSGTPPNQTVTCVAGGGGGGGGVPVCAPTASLLTPSRGQTSTISANCSNTPTGYTWSRGCTNAKGTCVVIEGKPTSITYTVSATNSTGTGATASITITWH
jgi:hypothetical protein